MREKKLRILVIAEAANPEWTSVPLLGWSFANALSKQFDIHLVTQQRNKEAIARAGWVEDKDFTALDTEVITKPLYNLANKLRGGRSLGWTIATAFASISYPYFEYLCWKRFEKKLESGEFDIVHRITPVSPTAPSYIAKKLKKLNIPFVVGPLNGGVAWPNEFDELRKKEKEWLTKVRSVYKILPGYRSLRKSASALICGSMATLNEMPEQVRSKTFYLPENAIDTDRFTPSMSDTRSSPLKAIFVGRLVPYKGADMAIEAMLESLKANKITYDIYGSGPEQEKLQSIIDKHELNGKVTIHGFVEHSELQQRIKNSDVLVFPSIREFGGGVVLEAMSLGVVPVIVDYAGPAELVNDLSGFKVPLAPRDDLIANLKAMITAIVEDPEIVYSKKANCVERIKQHFTWAAKVEQVSKIYHWTLDGNNKPEFSTDSFN